MEPTTPGDEIVTAPKQTGQFIDLSLERAQANNSTREFLHSLGVQAIKSSLFFSNALQAGVLRDGGLITDDILNPVVSGAGNVLTGQAPVNSQLATTTSLNTTLDNFTAQLGILATLVTELPAAIAKAIVTPTGNAATKA